MDYFARFTEGAKNALACAAEYAKSIGHNYVGTEHLLVGILQEKGPMAELLEGQGIDEQKVNDLLLKAEGKGDYQFTSAFGYTPRMKKILEISKALARQLQHN